MAVSHLVDWRRLLVTSSWIRWSDGTAKGCACFGGGNRSRQVALGFASPRTVRKHMPSNLTPGARCGSHAWSTFVRNHARSVLACDFFVAVTCRFAWCMYSLSWRCAHVALCTGP
jgi:hypothetical protein